MKDEDRREKCHLPPNGGCSSAPEPGTGGRSLHPSTFLLPSLFIPPPASFPSVRSYRRLSLFAAAWLAVLFVVGLGGEIWRREIFPFASWALFPLVPHHVTEYDLEFRAVHGNPLETPRRFSRAGGLVPSPHSVAAFHVIQGLGQALEHGRAAESRALRRQIDALCIPEPLAYDVVKITYDPVARHDTGGTLDRRVLGAFVTREP